ncbi:MAG: hypothetical protein HQL56_18435 [Magnetococcales bacterium]|nr:hypothetical protein [Magnetococcales bacterium]
MVADNPNLPISLPPGLSGWKQTLAVVAPTLATALGGPLAGMAARVAVQALGCEPGEESLAKAVTSGDQEVLLKLKQADTTFAQRLEELGVDRERIAASDRASAREREAKVGGVAAPLFGGIVLAGFFAVVGWALSGHLNLTGETGALIGMVIGYVSGKADQVVSYYFGSSAGQDHMARTKLPSGR